MTGRMKGGDALRTSLLTGMMLVAPALASAGLAHSSSSVGISGTIAGEHGTTTQPSGTVTGALDTKTRKLTFSIDYSGLSGPITAAHFHGPAGSGKEAGVLVPIKAPYASPINGTATLSPAEVTELRHGEIYVNLHTAAHPDGEARAQLVASTAAPG